MTNVIMIDSDDNRLTADIVTPLEKVTPLQWTGACLRIMARLIQNNKLNVHDVLQYQTYMAMLTSLAELYTWISSLQFNRQYRSLQDFSGFWILLGDGCTLSDAGCVMQTSCTTGQQETRAAKAAQETYQPQ